MGPDPWAREVETYSIDESFLDLSNFRPSERVELARDLRTTVLRWTGIPTCVGIGPSKTLAKAANAMAKKDPDARGVVDLNGTAILPPGSVEAVSTP